MEREEARKGAGRWEGYPVIIPYSEQGALDQLYKLASVEEVDYGAEGTIVTAMADARARGTLKKYLAEPEEENEDEEEEW